MHAGEKEIVDGFLEKIVAEYDSLKIEVLPLIPVAGVHTGVGTIALSYIMKD
jgi:fatty acid-binding protein DegV